MTAKYLLFLFKIIYLQRFIVAVESTVEHVILTVVCTLDEDIREDMSDYMLRVSPLLNVSFLKKK